MLVFGPIESRRLGRSLGINNVAAKTCSYMCPYCQAGRTSSMELRRTTFQEPTDIREAVEKKLAQLEAAEETIDYLSFVPTGEPTLDANLGRTIELLRPLGYRIAVISNATMLWCPEVRAELALADWVSLKVDAVRAEIWRWINRPLATWSFESVKRGVLYFSSQFSGTLCTETMLVRGVNDGEDHIQALAAFLCRVAPRTAYINTPSRAPFEKWVHTPEGDTLHLAKRILSSKLEDVVLMAEYSDQPGLVGDDAVEELLEILNVHPLRREVALDLLVQSGADPTVIDELLTRKLVGERKHEGQVFLTRT